MGPRSKTLLQSPILQEGKISYTLPFSLSLLWKFATGEKHRSGAATFLSDFWNWWVGDLLASSIFLFYISPNLAKPTCVTSITHLLHKVGYKKTLPWFVFFGDSQKKRKKVEIFVWFVGNLNKIAQKLENSPNFQTHEIGKNSLDYHHSVFFFQFSHVTPKVVRSHERL